MKKRNHKHGRIRRYVAYVMIFCIFFSCISLHMPAAKVKASSQAESLVSMAKSQLGMKERSSGSDDIIYNDWYYGRRVNNNGVSAKYAWCAVFVSWCAKEAGISNNIIPWTAGTTDMKNRLINAGGVSHLKGSGYNPKCGDIVFFGSNASQNVGIVKYSSQGRVYYIDGNNTQTNPHGVHDSNCSLSYSSLWGFVTPNYLSSAPTNSQICLDKQVYGLDHNIDMKLSADGGADYYTVQIWNGNQLICSKKTTDNFIKIPCSQLGAGTYGVYTTAYNNHGYCTSPTITFRIAEKLTNPHIYLNKDKFELSDEMQFTATADGGVDYYGLQIWKGATVVFQESFIGHTINVPCEKLGRGDYGAFVSCVNQSGSVVSEVIHFRIGSEPYNPQISINSNNLYITDTIKFVASADGGVDYYGLQIWEGGTVVFHESFIGHEINVPCNRLGEGQYGAFVSCVNSLGSITTDTVSFKIRAKEEESEIYGSPSFVWSSDLKTCSAEFMSQDNKGRKIIECMVTDNIVKESDCITSGIKMHIAAVCFEGKTYTDMKSETINKKDHVYGEWATTRKTTCTEEGERIRKCIYCQSIEISIIQRLGHKYSIEITNPTCIVSGTKEYICNNCNDSYTESIPATGHTWDAGKVTLEPTATTEGILTYTCTSCGETKTELIPATGQTENNHPDDKDNPDNKDKPDDKNNSDKDNTDTEDEKNPGKDDTDIEDEKKPDKDDIDSDDEKDSDKEETPDADENEEESNYLEIGDVAEDAGSGDEYEVISMDGNVVCVEYVESANPKAAVIKIPATIKTEDGTVCKVTSISKCAFKNNRRLKKVVIGSNVTVIGTNAFSGCKNLTSVTIGKNVVAIGASAFSNCTKLARLTIPAKVEKIGTNAFSGCKKLKKLDIKSRKLNAKGLNKKAFKGIPAKTLVRVPKDKKNIYQKLLCQKGLGKKNKIR